MGGWSDLASIFKFWRLPKVIIGLVQLLLSYRTPEFAARRMQEAKLCADHAIFQTSALTEIREGRSVMLLDLTGPREHPSEPEAGGVNDDAWTVFFVHGSMATMQQFEAQIAQIHEGGKHRVVAYDAYGCGQSPRPHDYAAYSQDNSMRDLSAVFDRYKGRKNLLVGHSYGCSQATRLAASRAEQVHGLVMIGPGYAPSHFPAGSIKVFKAPLIVLKMMRPLLSRGFAERAFHPHTRQASCQAHRRLLRRAQVFSGTNSMHVCQAFYQQMLWVDEELLHHIPCAVLVIVGEGDKVTPVTYAQAIHQVLRGNPRRLVNYSEVKEASHQVMQETPLRVSYLILEFMEKVEQGEEMDSDTQTVEM